MQNQSTNFWRRLRGAFRPFNLPRHYALGVSVGMAIGLIPSFSIVPWMLLLVGMLLPTNLLAMIGSIIIFSFVGPMLDPQSHRIGAAVLADANLSSFWQSVFANKYSIWLQFHNSVVLGSTLIAVAMVVPMFVVSKTVVRLTSPFVTKYLFSNSIADWIRGYPIQTG